MLHYSLKYLTNWDNLPYILTNVPFCRPLAGKGNLCRKIRHKRKFTRWPCKPGHQSVFLPLGHWSCTPSQEELSRSYSIKSHFFLRLTIYVHVLLPEQQKNVRQKCAEVFSSVRNVGKRQLSVRHLLRCKHARHFLRIQAGI